MTAALAVLLSAFFSFFFVQIFLSSASSAAKGGSLRLFLGVLSNVCRFAPFGAFFLAVGGWTGGRLSGEACSGKQHGQPGQKIFYSHNENCLGEECSINEIFPSALRGEPALTLFLTRL
jgi:hypothetical protein